MASVALQETWSRRNIPCVECMLFLARLEPERIRRHNLCLESPPGAARCRRCQHPETYGRCITIIRGSELACIAVNLIHAVKAFQASNDEDANAPQLARLSSESIREVRKLEEQLDMKTRQIKRLKEKFNGMTRAAKLEQKLDEKKHAVEELKTEIEQRKNRLRGLLNSIAM
ncbi:uncharacterized protein FTJAE_13773 [Fusarium tjaetaba]|uniref:Uncharacterized protein n=1 Tax=Fusarium tjaetaba TaxID=1567544 RepID=A0A8H5QDY4_9HYPO|nr:uncharacterized protein FTJAE_13773 [Fusarium tjaetaba]KAF5614096.1 hypothetical protein FTJAE_13773 [Fusarium tjaetaba]